MPVTLNMQNHRCIKIFNNNFAKKTRIELQKMKVTFLFFLACVLAPKKVENPAAVKGPDNQYEVTWEKSSTEGVFSYTIFWCNAKPSSAGKKR